MQYFFNTANGGFHADPEGTEFATPDQAKEYASIYAGEILRDHPNEIWKDDELTVTATDGTGLVLFSLLIMAHGSAALPN